MRIFDLVWKICLLIIGLIIIFLMATSADRRYEAFQNCNITRTAEICAQLFGK